MAKTDDKTKAHIRAMHVRFTNAMQCFIFFLTNFMKNEKNKRQSIVNDYHFALSILGGKSQLCVNRLLRFT